MVKGIAKSLAYNIGTQQNADYRTFRLERGVPFKRLGQPVVAVPQFKGVSIFSHTTQNALKSFSTTTPTITIAWPGALQITRGK